MTNDQIDAIHARVTSEETGGDIATVEVDHNGNTQIIDGIIEGMYYETSSGISGYTDEDGYFDYEEGDDEDSSEPVMVVEDDTIFMPALESLDIGFIEDNISISQSGIPDISEILVDIAGSESASPDTDIVIDIPSSDKSAESSSNSAVSADTPAVTTTESDLDYGSAPDPTVGVSVDDNIDTHTV